MVLLESRQLSKVEELCWLDVLLKARDCWLGMGWEGETLWFISINSVSFVIFFTKFSEFSYDVDVSRCENYPRSSGRWRFRCLVDWTWALLFMSFARAMAHILYWLSTVFLVTLDHCTLSCICIVVCLKIFFYNSWISLRSESLLRIFWLVLLYCVTCHLIKFIY